MTSASAKAPSEPPRPRPYRIALTGGPGGGKTTAADLFRREMGACVVIVPEAATLLYTGGFPRVSELGPRRVVQRTIYHVHRGLEDVQSTRFPERTLLCDRGTVDGAAYWPAEDPYEYFEMMGSTLEMEYARYDAVIFFESAAVGGNGIEGGNPARIESIEEAARLDTRLRRLWQRHPRYHHVPHSDSFIDKLTRGLATLRELVEEARAQES